MIHSIKGKTIIQQTESELATNHSDRPMQKRHQVWIQTSPPLRAPPVHPSQAEPCEICRALPASTLGVPAYHFRQH